MLAAIGPEARDAAPLLTTTLKDAYENALEGLAFAAKDALLVVDDFVPIATGDGALALRLSSAWRI